jgi:hypothetical protein
MRISNFDYAVVPDKPGIAVSFCRTLIETNAEAYRRNYEVPSPWNP